MMTPQAWPHPRELLWLWMNPSHRALLSLPSVKGIIPPPPPQVL